MTADFQNLLFDKYKESALFHRYIAPIHIAPLLHKYESFFDVKVIGKSVLGESIYAIIIGKGIKKVLMWSQMHGNESTTTKAIFDLCKLFSESSDIDINKIINNCTIAIIPMLNPDGANVFTRVNANEIDLNRDAKDLSQLESKVLRAFFDNFKPDFCFNLHGQRTIFSAGKHRFPATVSFLAPAQDQNCTITENRKKAMEIIVAMNKTLQDQIPNQVGIYDDAFNINCVGDMFQSHNIPTILFEAGHFNDDYGREETRRFIFQSLLTALDYISTSEITGKSYKTYLGIPENEKLYYDIIIRNALIDLELKDIAIQFQEKLINDKIDFIPIIEKIADLKHFYGHKEINADKNVVEISDLKDLKEGIEIDFVLLNNQKILLKP